MIIYTIFDFKKGKYWQAIDDMNSTEDWGEGFMFWFDENSAKECLQYHKKDDKDKEYKYCKVVKLTINKLDYE